MARVGRNLVGIAVCSALWCGAAFGNTAYYVEPDYAGRNGSSDGSRARPWSELDSGAWHEINDRLKSDDVTIYFSARETYSSRGEEYGDGVVVKRTDRSSHRLTLDGMSKYNTNDARPSAASWRDNSSRHRTKLIRSSVGYAIGWSSELGQKDNITIRGFEASGPQARVIFGGDNLVIEHMYIHDVTRIGPAMFLMSAPLNGGCNLFGVFRNIVIRQNRIERVYGEGIYLGGSDFCPQLGNTHDTILVENNKIIAAGSNGAQGDGIDVKEGLTNVTLRDNTIVDPRGQGITVSGAHGSERQNVVIERNHIFNASSNGILVGSRRGIPRGLMIRNNVVAESSRNGINLSGGQHGSNADILDVSVWSNTVARNGREGVVAGYVARFSMMNNLVFDNNRSRPSFQITVNSVTRNSGALIDFNLFSPGSDQKNALAVSGPNNVIVTDSSGLTRNPARRDYRLLPRSPAVNAGTALSGVSKDIEAAPRLLGSSPDIGAYECHC